MLEAAIEIKEKIPLRTALLPPAPPGCAGTALPFWAGISPLCLLLSPAVVAPEELQVRSAAGQGCCPEEPAGIWSSLRAGVQQSPLSEELPTAPRASMAPSPPFLHSFTHSKA